MSSLVTTGSYDLCVIGAGPAGQKAAVQGAKIGKRVLLCERAAQAGGECVRRGTIPSKALREQALEAMEFRKRMGSVGLNNRKQLMTAGIAQHLQRAQKISQAHVATAEAQLTRNNIERVQGQASFIDADTLEIVGIGGTRLRVHADAFIVATGSRPRATAVAPVDHEYVFDSDSILDLAYLPSTMAVLGGGVIACEYASIFLGLGAEVTLIDKAPEPLGFLDPDLRAHFVRTFTANGGRVMSGVGIERASFDGVGGVEVVTERGTVLVEKVLSALGRAACVDGLHLERAGVQLDERGYIVVDEALRAAANIYAAGDVIGPPALASTSMEQGRRAARHALGLPALAGFDIVPVGVYTIPELASVGLTEEQAKKKHGAEIVVGFARNNEIARGMIRGDSDGFLKIIADANAERMLGVHAAGAGAAELVHIGQLAMIGGLTLDNLVDHVFNFPTMAESFRVASLNAIGKRTARSTTTTSPSPSISTVAPI